MPLSSHMRSAVENISIHASRPKESSCCTIHNIKELKILRVFLDPWHKLKPIHLSVFCSMVVAWWVAPGLSGENSPTIFELVCSNCSPVTTVLRILHTLCPLWMWLLSFKSLQYCHLLNFSIILCNFTGDPFVKGFSRIDSSKGLRGSLYSPPWWDHFLIRSHFSFWKCNISVAGCFQFHFGISWQIYVKQKLVKLNNGQLFVPG